MSDELNTLYRYDERKFRESLSSDGDATATQEQLDSKIVIFTHILEKSLSNDNFEPGHGFDIVRYLAHLISLYEAKDYDKKSFGYTLALSVLKEFYALHKSTKYDAEVADILKNALPAVEANTSNIGGAMILPIKGKKDNSKKNFAELSAERYSIRTYAKKAVKKADIKDAVSVAMKTPTACNRQPFKVRAVYDKTSIEKLLAVQGGLAGYETPPSLLLVTTDDSSYFGPSERNQGYIDGGLFAMSLLYALEYKELAACALNCMFNEHDEKTIRGMLDVPENEKIIMFISCGYFNEESNVCKSVRYPVEEVLSEATVNDSYEVTYEEPSELERIVHQQNGELEVLRRPGVKLATRKALGAVRRRIYKTVPAPIKGRLRSVISRMNGESESIADGAIITICVYNNFGNILQRYALQEYLAQQGLQYDSVDMFDHSSEAAGYVNPTFIDFANKYIVRADYSDLAVRPYRRYIVGSDQIWRPEHLTAQKGGLSSFFLGFLGDRKVKRVSYAGSFGVDNLEEGGINREVAEEMKPLLRQFTAVSVREKSAVALVDQIADTPLHAKLVIDPTMLIDRTAYDAIIDDAPFEDKLPTDVFYFAFGNTPDYKEALEKISAKHGEYTHDWPGSVEGWLRAVRDAKIVVAGSFHAVVFSIIFHTDFVLFDEASNRNERVRNLLTILGISDDRIIGSNNESREFAIEKLEKIDWEKVDARINELRKDSGNWLLSNLK